MRATPRARFSAPFRTVARAFPDIVLAPTARARSSSPTRRDPRQVHTDAEKRPKGGGVWGERLMFGIPRVQLRRKKRDRRDTPTKRPYRRAGSPACTARVCRFSHRRTATTASPSLPYSPSEPLSSSVSVPRQPPPRYPHSTNASSPEKAHLSTPPDAAPRVLLFVSLVLEPHGVAQGASSRPLTPFQGLQARSPRLAAG